MPRILINRSARPFKACQSGCHIRKSKMQENREEEPRKRSFKRTKWVAVAGIRPPYAPNTKCVADQTPGLIVGDRKMDRPLNRAIPQARILAHLQPTVGGGGANHERDTEDQRWADNPEGPIQTS